MADLQTTIKFTGTLQSYTNAGGNAVMPDPTSLEFIAQTRVERQVFNIPGTNGVKSFVPADEGFVGVDLLKIEVLNLNKSLRLKFNGDPTGVVIKPVQPTGKSFFIATAAFNTVEMINEDASTIQVMVSAYEKYNG